MRKKPLPMILIALSFLLGSLMAQDEGTPTAKLLREALFAEEADRDLVTAEKGYREIVKKFDTDRVYAATAILRLAEILHQRGDMVEAEKWFARVLQEFPDQKAVVKVATNRLGDKATALLAGRPVQVNPQAEEIARISKLLEQSPDLLNTPKDGTTLLATAASKGQLDVVEFLLSKGARIRENRDANFPSALAAAVARGHLGVTTRLLEEKPKLEKDLIHKAVKAGNYAITELLLKSGADPNQSAKVILDSHEGYVRENPRVFRLYEHRKPEFSTQRADGRFEVDWTPLEISTNYRYAKLTDLLLAKGAKSQFDERTFTEDLRFAIIDGDDQLVAKLLKNGADPNSRWDYQENDGDRGREKFSSIVLATGLQNIEIMKLLIKSGADLDLVGFPSLGPPLSHANLAAAKVLIAAGADPNYTNKQGDSLLHQERDLAKTNLLLSAGANLNARNEDGLTPLMVAVRDLNADKVKALLKAGADPNGLPNYPAPLTMLPNTASIPYGPTIRALVEAGAKPDVVDIRNRTPITYAAGRNELETVRYLLEKGAKLEVEDRPVFEWAPNNSEIKIELFLKTYQQAERRRGKIRMVDSETGAIIDEVTAVTSTDELPDCPYSILEAYFFSSVERKFAFGKVTVWREGEEEPMTFDLRKIIASGDPAQDVALKWGDLVQFTEAKLREETAVNEAEKKFLDNHLNRDLKFVSGEDSRMIRLELEWQRIPNSDSWLRKRTDGANFTNTTKSLPLVGPKNSYWKVSGRPGPGSSNITALREWTIERNKKKTEGFASGNSIRWFESGDIIHLDQSELRRYHIRFGD